MTTSPALDISWTFIWYCRVNVGNCLIDWVLSKLLHPYQLIYFRPMHLHIHVHVIYILTFQRSNWMPSKLLDCTPTLAGVFPMVKEVTENRNVNKTPTYSRWKIKHWSSWKDPTWAVISSIPFISIFLLVAHSNWDSNSVLLIPVVCGQGSIFFFIMM